VYFFLFCSLQTVIFRQNTLYKIFIKRNKVFLYFELQLPISRNFCRSKKLPKFLFYIYRVVLTCPLPSFQTQEAPYATAAQVRITNVIVHFHTSLEVPLKCKLQFHQLFF